jgi:hypothetical protein
VGPATCMTICSLTWTWLRQRHGGSQSRQVGLSLKSWTETITSLRRAGGELRIYAYLPWPHMLLGARTNKHPQAVDRLLVFRSLAFCRGRNSYKHGRQRFRSFPDPP